MRGQNLSSFGWNILRDGLSCGEARLSGEQGRFNTPGPPRRVLGERLAFDTYLSNCVG